MLEKSGATFSTMNNYLRGRLSDDEGAAQLLRPARNAFRTAFSISI
jgi:hydroxypyruvate isomerase